MKFQLCFLEYHSDIGFWKKEDGVTLESVDSEGWGEFMHKVNFTADSIEQATEKAWELYDGTSGVFSVFHKGKLAFTEEAAAVVSNEPFAV
jgi:hypothetical protein